MKIQATFSLAEAAGLMQFPGGTQDFIYSLRKQRYLMGNLTPYQFCIEAGWMICYEHPLPDPRKFSQGSLVPRLTIKGLNYFTRKFQCGYNYVYSPDSDESNTQPF